MVCNTRVVDGFTYLVDVERRRIVVADEEGRDMTKLMVFLTKNYPAYTIDVYNLRKEADRNMWLRTVIRWEMLCRAERKTLEFTEVLHYFVRDGWTAENEDLALLYGYLVMDRKEGEVWRKTGFRVEKEVKHKYYDFDGKEKVIEMVFGEEDIFPSYIALDDYCLVKVDLLNKDITAETKLVGGSEDGETIRDV